jgi:hypothetical protein
MSERIDLDAVERRFKDAAQHRRVWHKDHIAALALSAGDVPALVGELRELRKDQDNWFAYLRWRGKQDDREEAADTTGP